jgi:hypothetical protein
MSESQVIDFGFDDANIIKISNADVFKQSKNGEIARVSLIWFKTHHESYLKKETIKKGGPLTNEETAALFEKIDKKLAEKLNKSIEQLTEVDRLNIGEPKFKMNRVHYKEGLGTIKCLSRYEGSTIVKAEECCNRLGDADQRIGTVIMTYPIGDEEQIDFDLLNAKKYTKFWIYVLAPKKAMTIKSCYDEAKREGGDVIDLKVKLDGDPKFQKQIITGTRSAGWAKDTTNPEIKNWILEQGLRLQKYIVQNLGYDMKVETMLEKLGAGQSSSYTQNRQDSGGEAPKQMVQSYTDLLT